jgi:hypothetical protein
MKAILLTVTTVLICLALPAKAQSAATVTTCITGQLLCNKACGKGPTAVPCINTCGMKAQMCASNNGRWPGADSSSSDDEDKPARSSSRRNQKQADPEDEEEDEPQPSKSSSSSRSKGRSDGKCTTDAEFVHSWPDGQSNYRFNFKFRVSSDDCSRYGCNGWVHYRIHFNYPGGSSGKTTLVRYRIPQGQRSTEVTDSTYPFNVGTKIDIRDVEIGEVSCSSP